MVPAPRGESRIAVRDQPSSPPLLSTNADCYTGRLRIARNAMMLGFGAERGVTGSARTCPGTSGNAGQMGSLRKCGPARCESCATARKLIVIAWHMLKNNEPYRYAEPRRTKIKLRLLRRKIEGPVSEVPRRPKGSIPAPPGKTVEAYPPLAQIYEREGLPPMKEVPSGEKKAIKKAAVSTYVRSLGRQTVYLRKKWQPKS